MYRIQTLNEISEKGLAHLPADKFVYGKDLEQAEGILVRSQKMHDMKLDPALLGIARAGAGTNNIPVEKCAEDGIVVFNTPGANANAVKELTVAALLMASRKIAQGIQWTNGLTGDIAGQVEKGKKNFVGPEIAGKTLGVIGLGAIGVMVANAAVDLDMEAVCYDPYLQVESAWHLSRRAEHEHDLAVLAAKSDYITIHVPANKDTNGLIGEEFLNQCKDGVRIINYARGELVDIAAMKKALESGKVAAYVTDFPEEEFIGLDNVVMTPHLGASTPESEENCAVMAAKELRDFLLYGNITHSVNFPDCSMPYTGKARISIINKNIPNMIGSFTAIFAKEGINIANMTNKSRGEWAYNIIDADSLNGKEEQLLAALNEVEGIVRARIVQKGEK